MSRDSHDDSAAEDPGLVQLGGGGGGEEPELDPSTPGMVNIRNISIKCGNCDTYQTLAAFSRRDDWNVYSYECENDVCDPDVTRTYVEVPQDLDAFARRDPGWRGGKVHAGG